jgi:Transposase DDE domain group 1
VSRYRGKVKRLYFRGDAAFASPEMYEFLEAEGIGYTIRLPANSILQDRIGYLLKRPVGRPPRIAVAQGGQKHDPRPETAGIWRMSAQTVRRSARTQRLLPPRYSVAAFGLGNREVTMNSTIRPGRFERFRARSAGDCRCCHYERSSLSTPGR